MINKVRTEVFTYRCYTKITVVTNVQVFKQLIKLIHPLIWLICMMCFNCKATATNYTDNSCHKNLKVLSNQSYGVPYRKHKIVCHSYKLVDKVNYNLDASHLNPQYY